MRMKFVGFKCLRFAWWAIAISPFCMGLNCLQSKTPFYAESDTVSVQYMSRIWSEGSGTTIRYHRFTQKEGNHYLHEERVGEATEWTAPDEVTPFRINGDLYFDIKKLAPESGIEPRPVGAHVLAKVYIVGGSVIYVPADPPNVDIRKTLEKDIGTVNMQLSGKSYPVLAGSPEAYRAAITAMPVEMFQNFSSLGAVKSLRVNGGLPIEDGKYLNRKRRNFDYWCVVRGYILTAAGEGANWKPGTFGPPESRYAESISSLDPAGADEDLVRAGMDVADAMARLGDLRSPDKRGTRNLSALLQGALTGETTEIGRIRDDEAKIGGDINEAITSFRKVGKLLSARYSQTYPDISVDKAK